MKPGQMFDDRQAKARAADLTRTRTIGAVKPLEYSLRMFGENAFASVGNRDNLASVGLFIRDPDAAAAPVKLDSVVDKVRQHLLQTHQIGENDSRVGDLVFQLDLAVLRLGRQGIQDIVDGGGELDLADLDGDIARFDQRKLENIGDQAVHTLGVAADDAEKSEIVFLVVDDAVLKRLDKREYRGQRRAQL